LCKGAGGAYDKRKPAEAHVGFVFDEKVIGDLSLKG